MESARRPLVLEFFISHFIAMARSSEKFDAIKQVIIYLEQAQRLCIILQYQPGYIDDANKLLEVVRDKLADCQRKLVKQSGFKLPHRESQIERSPMRPIVRIRPKYPEIVAQASPQNSPLEHDGTSAFTFVDVHVEISNNSNEINFEDIEESKL